MPGDDHDETSKEEDELAESDLDRVTGGTKKDAGQPAPRPLPPDKQREIARDTVKVT
jgi:hypothetical protein